MLTSIFKLFAKPSAQEIVETNLEEYERRLLDHQASTAYHKKMSEYYAEGLDRLKKFQPSPVRITSGT